MDIQKRKEFFATAIQTLVVLKGELERLEEENTKLRQSSNVLDVSPFKEVYPSLPEKNFPLNQPPPSNESLLSQIENPASARRGSISLDSMKAEAEKIKKEVTKKGVKKK